eukprot:TRINITY_DN2174_c0_g1_i1.p1 TRINITY_DN2174_c0_g1~~TRINITY_DN2174_c0_g1_i1.p1  ORF type:complete len:491 (-),score=139.51 TRINITY_DN2174_c0_g1_i1:42-1514(-)
MMQVLFVTAAFVAGTATAYSSWNESYLAKRAEFVSLQSELHHGFSSNEAAELAADKWIAQQVYTIAQAGNIIGKPFLLPGMKQAIEDTELFKVMDTFMPKGAVLHLHESSCGSLDWIVEKGIFLDGCYVSWDFNNNDSSNSGTVQFFSTGNSRVPDGFYRAAVLNSSIVNFQDKLKSMYTAPFNSADPWMTFGSLFGKLDGLIHHLPAYLLFLEDAFTRMVQNKIQHIELRTDSMTYFIDPETRTPVDQLEAAKAVISVCQKFEEFLSVRFIVYGRRSRPEVDAEVELTKAFILKQAFPEYFIGFDLVEMEDTGTTLSFLELFLVKKPELEQQFGFNMPLFLHDGESSNADDSNLIDALLLGSKRIGHGLNLVYYPLVEQMLIAQRIPVEVSPLSNHILGFVSDLRFHPAGGYFRRNVPMVLSSDDPMLFGYTGMTHDFFQAIVNWRLKLQDIKQLIYSSVEFSALSGEAKTSIRKTIDLEWQRFVSQLQ